MRQLTAQDVMHVPVPCLPARESFARAVTELLRHDVSCFLVPPEGGRRDYGIVTKHDLLERVNNRRRNPWQLRVAELMTTPLCTVTPHTALAACAELLVDHEIGSLPVFEAGQPVGILNAAQVFGALEARGWGVEVAPALRRAGPGCSVRSRTS